MKALTIARLTFREAFQRKLVWGVLALSLVFAVLYAYGFHLLVNQWHDIVARRAAGERTNSLVTYSVLASNMVMLGLYTVNFLAGIMTIFAAVGSIAGEIDSGTLHAIVPKPLGRWEIVLGKYIGFATMIVIYIAAMVTAVALSARYVGSYTPPNLVKGTLLIILVSIILLSLTMFGTTIFSTMTNGVIVFMLYGMAMTGGLVEQIGTLLNNNTMINMGIISSILVPSDSMWRLASYTVQPLGAVSFTGPNPLGTTVPPSMTAVEYSIAYCVVLLVGAMLVFRYRDL
ncbi:MAG TPA: ABC transporter permease [Thermomicrobiaceae bacterium]|nr:ABC transporter permease [Thermomicrobiaceae bacterium]